MRSLGAVEATEIDVSVIDLDARFVFAARADDALTALSRMAVRAVLGMGRVAQIVPAIIALNAVAMIHEFSRPAPRHPKHSQPRAEIDRAVDADLPIALLIVPALARFR